MPRQRPGNRGFILTLTDTASFFGGLDRKFTDEARVIEKSESLCRVAGPSAGLSAPPSLTPGGI